MIDLSKYQKYQKYRALARMWGIDLDEALAPIVNEYNALEVRVATLEKQLTRPL